HRRRLARRRVVVAHLHEADRREDGHAGLQADRRALGALAARGLTDLVPVPAGHIGHTGEALDRARAGALVGEAQLAVDRAGRRLAATDAELQVRDLALGRV